MLTDFQLMKENQQLIVNVHLMMIQHVHEQLLDESEKENIMIMKMYYIKNNMYIHTLVYHGPIYVQMKILCQYKFVFSLLFRYISVYFNRNRSDVKVQNQILIRLFDFLWILIILFNF